MQNQIIDLLDDGSNRTTPSRAKLDVKSIRKLFKLAGLRSDDCEIGHEDAIRLPRFLWLPHLPPPDAPRQWRSVIADDTEPHPSGHHGEP